jgi:prophage DNA circulation protein
VLDLARRPGELAREILDGVAEVAGLARTPARALAALRPLLWFGDSLALAAGLASNARRERDNAAALQLLVRQAAAIESVRAVTAINFDSYDDAVRVRTELADAIDDLETDTADAGEEAAWRALVDLRGAMVRDVTARGGSLARLFRLTPQSVEPALVLAYRIYADADRDAEIVARNRVARPGFVPAGAALELLTPIDQEASGG